MAENHFRLFAHGEEFDPDEYLTSTPLSFDGAWYKGESGDNHPKSSGVFKILGDGSTTSLPKQERIAIEYLSSHRDALKALAQYPGVETFILGMQLVWKARSIEFAVGPSTLLMQHCLAIGIRPAYYISRGRPQTPTQS